MEIKNVDSRVATAIIGSPNENLSDEDGFGDAEALRRAFRDPRYQTSASYRKLVQDAIEASEAIKDAAPGASALTGGQLNGSFQVTPRVTHDDASAAPDYSDEHSQRMIALATSRGL